MNKAGRGRGEEKGLCCKKIREEGDGREVPPSFHLILAQRITILATWERAMTGFSHLKNDSGFDT